MHFDSGKLLGLQGLLANKLPAYEYREVQVEMADNVYQALLAEAHTVIEAGTGVGKSLAYLLPLLYYTVQEKKRAVVATHTIALQEQLFQKDIPFLQKILPFEFTAEVFKGRGNYLCLRRWHELGGQMEFGGDLEALNLWVQTTDDGDLSTAPFSLPPELYFDLRCEKESCSEEECSYFSDCFYWNLRHRLGKADLIITNQAMLLAHLGTEGRVLPAFQCVVIDEAHNLEEVATNAFSHRILKSTFLAHYRTGTQLLATLQGLIPEFLLQDINLALDDILKETVQYFTQIEPHITGYTLSLTTENRAVFQKTILPKQLEHLEKLLALCDVEDSETAILTAQFLEFTMELQETLDLILTGTDPGFVYWAEMQNGAPALIAAPIQVNNILREFLFEKTPTAILTSATLSTNKSFNYIQEQLGLTEAKELLLGSPFDFSQQALLCVPKRAQHPNNPNYPRRAAFLVLHTVAATQGGVLVLFTSYNLMDEVADLIMPKLTSEGYSLFKQGDGPRLGLIEDFQGEPRSLLFGTNSFWEGIDIPGTALKAVVITRLPFAVPNRPVTKARLTAIEEAGGNPFLEYSVPQAILRLKQGFGRLIRSTEDKGGVVILDERIVRSSYGAQFLESLPPARFSRDLEDLRRLFGN